MEPFPRPPTRTKPMPMGSVKCLWFNGDRQLLITQHTRSVPQCQCTSTIQINGCRSAMDGLLSLVRCWRTSLSC